MFRIYPLIAEYLSGTTASGIYEAKLAHEEFHVNVGSEGKPETEVNPTRPENHVFEPAYKPEEMQELCRICTHIYFNSIAQLELHRPIWEPYQKAGKLKVALRINPEHSTQEGHEIYDPCAVGSRLGIRRALLPEKLPDGVSGLHFHTLCEQGVEPLIETFRSVEEIMQISGINMENLTLGHTTEPGGCASGVLYLTGCENIRVEGCRLFGCGSMGLTADDSQSVFLSNTRIDSCSDGAVTANHCTDLRLEDCQLCDCGLSQDFPGGSLLYTERCRGFALVNCEITGNRVYQLLQNQWSEQVSLLGCRVENNRVLNSFFVLQGRSVTVDKCSFQRRSSEDYYAEDRELFAHDPAGEDLISFDLDHMELGRAEYSGPVEEPFVVACGEGSVEILELQPEGKKKMTAEAFAAGHQLKVGDSII